MNKLKLFFCMIAIAIAYSFQTTEKPKSIYDFKIKAIDGGIIDFASFRGKVILIVNTASLCGYTIQYENLEKLYEAHKDKLVIVAFPSSNFDHEYLHDSSIINHCLKNFNVTFPVASRINITGRECAPLFTYLIKLTGTSIQYDFEKFIFDESGNFKEHFYSQTPSDFVLEKYF